MDLLTISIIACATVFGKIPYYEGINIKSATPTKLFTSIVMPINSWKITAGNPYKTHIYSYAESIWRYADTQLLYFHGARNTKYSFYFNMLSDFTHGSLGTLNDYHYFMGIIFYDPQCKSTDDIYTSTYLGISNIKNISSFQNIEMSFTTDNNGNFTFQQLNCYYKGHNSNFTLYFYLNNYPQHKLIFSNYLQNTNPNHY